MSKKEKGERAARAQGAADYAELCRDRYALTDGGQRTTWKHVAEDADRVAELMRAGIL